MNFRDTRPDHRDQITARNEKRASGLDLRRKRKGAALLSRAQIWFLGICLFLFP